MNAAGNFVCGCGLAFATQATLMDHTIDCLPDLIDQALGQANTGQAVACTTTAIRAPSG